MSDGGREKRLYPRTPLVTRLRLTHDAFGTVVVKTRDISQGGVYLVTDDLEIPPVGTILLGQIQDDYDEERPVVKMEVVRIEPAGVGLRFVD